MTYPQSIKKYLDLRREVDVRCQELSALHADHLACRAGCDQCCMDFGLLPVEYHAILLEAGDALQHGRNDAGEGECPFLTDHHCLIYAHRPIICRTQGLPLLFLNDEQWELSACELNFTRFDPEGFSFENTFPQDRFNSMLYLINQEFIREYPGLEYNGGELLSLNKLSQHQS
jgi:uncharacterized protein